MEGKKKESFAKLLQGLAKLFLYSLLLFANYFLSLLH